MNEPLGEYGGEVTRKVTLFKTTHKVGDKLSPELLGEISLRHRIALTGAGLIKYYSEPEGAAAGFSTEPPSSKTTDNIKQPPTKKKTSDVKTKGKKTPKSSKP